MILILDDKGKAIEHRVCSRWIGLLTIGISTYFTSPCLYVRGVSNEQTEASFKELQEKCGAIGVAVVKEFTN